MGRGGHRGHKEQGVDGCRRDFKEGIVRAWEPTGSKCWMLKGII